MFDCSTAGDVGRVERITLNGIAGLLPAFLYHELDDIHVDGGSEDRLQLLLGRFAQDALAALIGEEYLEGCIRGQETDKQSTRLDKTYNPRHSREGSS